MTCTQEAQAETRSGERPALKRYLDGLAVSGSAAQGSESAVAAWAKKCVG